MVAGKYRHYQADCSKVWRNITVEEVRTRHLSRSNHFRSTTPNGMIDLKARILSLAGIIQSNCSDVSAFL